MTMTMTSTDVHTVPVAADDWVVSPRAERPRRRFFTAEYKLQVLGRIRGRDAR